MVAQYRYTLEMGYIAETPERDEDGNYTEGRQLWKCLGRCRDEAATKGDFTTTTDGEKVSFSWIVYAPLSTPDILFGKTVRVTDGETVRAIGTVKRFYRGQLNCRIWL